MKKFQVVTLFGALIFTAGCGGGSGGSGGGGGGTPPPPGCAFSASQSSTSSASSTVAAAALNAQNVASLIVDGGVKNNYANGVFTSVTVCIPGKVGTTNCQIIDHVLVDTGSFGLRLLNTSGGGQLSLAGLPSETDSTGLIAECAQFSDGITWGAVRMADVYIGGATADNMAGEKALNIPFQIIGDASVGAPPSGCTAFGTPEDNISSLLANGIVGVGPFPQDCGPGCATDPTIGLYYHCSSAGCVETTVPLASQVVNPVAAFAATSAGAKDNNGAILQLPAVPTAGASIVNGSLIFGIATETNNLLGNAKMYTADPSTGNITTVFAQHTLSGSFIDSGSNGYFFLDSATTSIPTCGTASNAPGFYCPTTALTCSAVNQGANGAQGTVTFNVDSATVLVNSGNSAYNNLAGPNSPPPNPGGGPPPPAGFDWGLSFFYGRSVYTGMEILDSSGNVKQPPYFAY